MCKKFKVNFASHDAVVPDSDELAGQNSPAPAMTDSLAMLSDEQFDFLVQEAREFTLNDSMERKPHSAERALEASN